GRDPQGAGGRDDPGADIAESIVVVSRCDGRIEDDRVRSQEISLTGGMHAEHEEHRRRLWAAVDNLVSDVDLHRSRAPEARPCPGMRAAYETRPDLRTSTASGLPGSASVP